MKKVPAAESGAAIVEVPNKQPGLEPVRIFDDSAIRAAVDRATSSLKADETIAVVAFFDTDKTLRTAVTWRIGDEWSIVGKVEKKWKKPIAGEAMVVWAR